MVECYCGDQMCYDGAHIALPSVTVMLLIRANTLYNHMTNNSSLLSCAADRLRPGSVPLRQLHGARCRLGLGGLSGGQTEGHIRH